MTAELRPYQIEVIEKCREEIKVGNDKIIIVAPTGSGKTIVAGSIIKSVVAKDKRALLLCPTREIINRPPTSSPLKVSSTALFKRVSHPMMRRCRSRAYRHYRRARCDHLAWKRRLPIC